MAIRSLLVILGLSVALTSNAAPGAPSPVSQSSKRSAQSDHSAQVTGPYDPNLVTVTYVATDTGGVQRVRANESGDAAQIGRIRATLQHLADDFRNADLGNGASAKRAEMSALATLVAAPHGALRTMFVEIRGGAEVRFIADDPAVIAAVHQWFDAMRNPSGAAAPAPTQRQ
jgi:hypothetical protein